MHEEWKIDLKFIEQGDIYFFYKPKKGINKTTSIEDVSRFYLILDPHKAGEPRYIVMGNKRLPSVNDGGRSTWGFVQIVGGRGFKTILEQTNTPKNSARPAGEGIYTILAHRNHTHLMYSMELPKKPGVVQQAFNIKKEADYIFLNRSVQQSEMKSDEPFSNFSKVDLELLNQQGTEILLVGVGTDLSRLGIKANANEETLNTADIFTNLEINTDRHPTNALISGTWI